MINIIAIHLGGNYPFMPAPLKIRTLVKMHKDKQIEECS